MSPHIWEDPDSGFDSGNAIAIDSSGNIYVAGETQSLDFPTTTGAYNTSGGGFVSKFNGDLTNLLASTYLGVSIDAITIDTEENIYVAGDDTVSKLNGDLTSLLASKSLSGGSINAIAIGAGGNIYVTGYTNSADFPTTSGAYDTSFNGGDGDAFVSKLGGDLTSLLASTYLGGYYGDQANAIAIDSWGNIYVTGWTWSSDFPTTPGAYDTSFNGDDAFVSKLNGALTSLLASTSLGGSDNDQVNSIAIDSGGNVYVAGYTYSRDDFPTTPGAYKTSFCSDYDSGDCRAENVGFVSELNGDLTNLLASTYLGGDDSNTYANSLAIDSSGNICVASYYQSTIGYESYVSVEKLNGDLTSLLASAYLGGSSSEHGNSIIAISIDAWGNIYVTGYTNSADFPTTSGAYDTSFNGGYGDAFVSKLSGDLSLLASTYLGGTGDGRDSGNAIAIDSGGYVYVTGSTGSTNFPTTIGAYDTSFNGYDFDVFVSKLNSDLTTLLSSTYLGGTGSDAGNAIAIDAGGNIYVAGDDTVSKLNGDLTSLLASKSLSGGFYQCYSHRLRGICLCDWLGFKKLSHNPWCL